MNNIQKFRKYLGYSPKQFAKLMKVERATVLLWEDGTQKPDYEMLKRFSLLFHISPDFILETRIFAKWKQILEYYDAVSSALQRLIPERLILPTYCNDKFFNVWLDTRCYFNSDEIELSRWFAFAVQDIQIVPTGYDPSGTKTADVEIVFTPEFNALIQAEQAKSI